jgi:hypothetical protein
VEKEKENKKPLLQELQHGSMTWEKVICMSFCVAVTPFLQAAAAAAAAAASCAPTL